MQVVKTVVDKKSLKSKSVPAGSANVKTGVLSDQLLSSLNEKEVQDVRRWIEGRQRVDMLRREVDARLLEQRIYEAIGWLKDAPTAAAAEVVVEALDAMKAFRRMAIKLGLAKAERKQQR